MVSSVQSRHSPGYIRAPLSEKTASPTSGAPAGKARGSLSYVLFLAVLCLRAFSSGAQVQLPRVPCAGGQVPNHCTTREAQSPAFLKG